MTKQELVDYIADNAGLNKKDSTAALSSLVEGLKSALKKGDSVTIVGFGTFSVSKKSARKGRNPQTGATINIPARSNPVFKAGKAFKEGFIVTSLNHNLNVDPAPSHDGDGGIGGIKKRSFK